MSYKQLTQEQRYPIAALKKAGLSQIDIATEVGVHKSTITRELQRNCRQRGYRPKQAHALAQSRQRDRARTPRIAPETWEILGDGGDSPAPGMESRTNLWLVATPP